MKAILMPPERGPFLKSKGTVRRGFLRLHRAYLLPSIARTDIPSQDDGAETQSGLRADPGAVPGASTLAA